MGSILGALCAGFVLGYVVFAVTTSYNAEAKPTNQCPQGYYCMTNSDEMALQTFIDRRCVKLDHGKY